MRLDSVRELKQALPGQLNKAFAVRAAAGKTGSLAVVRAAALTRDTPSYFLGVSARGKKDYRLAVRLQDRALERSELVKSISSRAKGEVDVRYVGRIRARATPWYRSRQRPLLIGSSTGFIGTGFIMAGTLGCFVRSGSSSVLYILSNNHVLADENRYPKGRAIVQAGELDGGPRDIGPRGHPHPVRPARDREDERRRLRHREAERARSRPTCTSSGGSARSPASATATWRWATSSTRSGARRACATGV